MPGPERDLVTRLLAGIVGGLLGAFLGFLLASGPFRSLNHADPPILSIRLGRGCHRIRRELWVRGLGCSVSASRARRLGLPPPLNKMPPNKRLKLAGGDRFRGIGVLCPGGHGLSSNGLAPASESPAA